MGKSFLNKHSYTLFQNTKPAQFTFSGKPGDGVMAFIFSID
jgi:hypothetical protein